VTISFWDYFRVGARLTIRHTPDRDAVAVAVTSTNGKPFNPFSLDDINLLLADVQGALGLP
jgi:hypothetical protein